MILMILNIAVFITIMITLTYFLRKNAKQLKTANQIKDDHTWSLCFAAAGYKGVAYYKNFRRQQYHTLHKYIVSSFSSRG